MNAYYIGLLSGTSVDGIDAAIVDFGNGKIKMVCSHEQSFSSKLKKDLQNLIKSQHCSLVHLSETDSLLAFEFSQAIEILLNKAKLNASDIIAIGSHGQTIFHEGEGNHTNTIQIGCPHKLAANLNINVVTNFRNLDMAFNGQGAPLAPLIHKRMFEHKNKNTAVINLGGIANITFIGPDFDHVLGYDIGPANCLIDEWIKIHQQKPFDNNGQWASKGQLNPQLLAQMLDDDYFKKPAPKSTGREYFNHKWYDAFVEQFKITSAVDIQNTLTHLVAASIKNAIKDYSIDNMILMGGGANNQFLISLIDQYCQIESETSNLYGYDSDWVEAILFAYLAFKRVNEQEIDLHSFTGSTRPILVGDIIQVRQ